MMNDSQTSSTQHTASTGRSCAHSSTLALSPYSSDSSSPTSNQRMEDPLPLLSERAAGRPPAPPPDGGLGSAACRLSQQDGGGHRGQPQGGDRLCDRAPADRRRRRGRHPVLDAA